MAAIPFMPFYIADYLADASHLTTFEHGAYLLLIMNYWQRGEALPADEQKLARIARVNLRQWRLMAPTIEAFFSVRGNSWHHNRINSELHKVRAKSLKARESGLASVERKRNESSTNVQRTFNHTDTDTDTEEKGVSNDTPKGGKRFGEKAADPPDWIPRKAWDDYAAMRQRIRKPMTARAAELVVAKLDALRTSGCPPGDVLDQSTMHGWQGVFELKDQQNGNAARPMAASTGGKPIYRSNPALDRYRDLIEDLDAAVETDAGPLRLHS